jgi:hypothetical protein
MIVFAEPSAIPAEMIMRICALLTGVGVRLAPLHMMVEEGRARSILFFDELDLRGDFSSPPLAPS